MHRASLIVLVLGSLLGSLLALLAPELGQALESAAVGIMPISEIKPGMKGYGLTVFRGEQPERFDVEVIDVLKKFRPDQDLVLVRTLHPILERAITVGGMSGSPIYLDGKLIGAYAYGWTFGKEPIAGVTPIQSMLAEISRPVDPQIWKALGTLPLSATGAPTPAQRKPVASARPRSARLDGAPAYLGAQRQDAFTALREQAQRLGLAAADGGGASPFDRRPTLTAASTPLLLAGMTDGAVNALAAQLDRFGLVALQAGGAAAAPTPGASATAHFVDGGAIGVQLMRGDINATAIGTVTHVQGQRLVAFGHPMLNAGQVGLATCTARVLHVLSSEQRSFKIAEAITPHGTLIHDRQAAIVVDEQLQADMLPVSVRIHGVPGAPAQPGPATASSPRTSWDVEVASQRFLTPSLTFGAIMSALQASAVDNTDVVYKLKSRVSIDGHGTIETEDIGYTPVGASDASSLARARMFSVLAAAYGNPFEDVRVSRVELDIDVRYEHDLVDIVDAMVSADEVDPDKDVNVYVTLRRFGQAEETRIVPVHMPWSAAGETVEIAIEPGDDVQLDQPKPNSLDDILRAVSSGYPATSLVVSAKLPAQGVKLRGQIVRSLPGSMLDTLQAVNESERATSFATYQRNEVPFGHVLTGSAKVKVNVRQEPLR